MVFSTKDQIEAPLRPREQRTAATAETRPRKVNSEVRKQQNRIASRNYREKRKRKLQHLQQLLDDDESSEQQTHTRSTSPSCSGSVDYEHSATSSSPHITTVPVNLNSPQLEQAPISTITWSSVIPSTSHSYTHSPYLEQVQDANAYTASGSVLTGYPTTNAVPWTANTHYVASEMTHYSAYPSQISTWPAHMHSSTNPHTLHQQETMSGTSFYAPSWQYQTKADTPTGVVMDPYGRRHHSYDAC